MRRKPVVGETWTAKVSGVVVEVKVRGIRERTSSLSARSTTRYVCENLRTGRTIDVHRNRLRARVIQGRVVQSSSGLFVFTVRPKWNDPSFESAPIVAESEDAAKARLELTYSPDRYTLTLAKELS